MTCPGAGGTAGDIIDLDRYMRAAVRRSASDTTDDDRIEKLVVDGGGGCGGGGGVDAGGAAGGGKTALVASSSSAECAARPHHKRFSHDSGLSDGSYAPRVRRPHRRLSGAEGAGGGRVCREGREGRGANNSSNSLREFRAVCERALLDQQQQIARVALLCERLTEKRARPPPPTRTPARAPAEPDTSDISSSSTSTKDQRRKDKHRADECKTYKIIMNKLDELNRLFAARGRSPPATVPRGPPDPAPRRRAPSSHSVSVSDKLVSTEPRGKLSTKSSSQPSRQKDRSVVERAVGGGEWSAPRPARAVTRAYALDIAPHHVAPASCHRNRPNVATESIVERGSSGEDYVSSMCDPRCGFDLDDPLHLYAQAKRLQALHASTRRSKSAGHEARRGGRREASLCALCRGYWRAVRRYIGAQLTTPNL